MIVQRIEKNSPAQQLGLRVGDKIERINGHAINDIIDYRFYISDEEIDMDVRRNGQLLSLSMEKEPDDDLGLSFEPTAFRCCGNQCIFCFVDQNPEKLRSQLYFKDEDFRLSFLHGNYVTMTNIKKRDLERIVEQRLSPLYISVHATDPKVRLHLLGLKRDDHLLEKIKYLTDHRIELHAQVVLCPTINDGEILKRTIDDLLTFYPQLKSVAIVPVGLTRHRQGLYPLKAAGAGDAKRLIDTMESAAVRYRLELKSHFVYLADEFYLLADRSIPPASRYEEYYQIENGVGMMRDFMDRFDEQSDAFPSGIEQKMKFTIVTAEMAQFFFRRTVLPRLNAIQGLEVSLAVIENLFYGNSVQVTGLLTGGDICRALKERPGSDLILLPENCVNGEGLFLDDWTVDRLERELNCRIRLSDGDFNGLLDSKSITDIMR